MTSTPAGPAIAELLRTIHEQYAQQHEQQMRRKLEEALEDVTADALVMAIMALDESRCDGFARQVASRLNARVADERDAEPRLDTLRKTVRH